MKPQEQKEKFILMRAEGKSYTVIAKALCISKATCQSWDNSFKERIAELKQEQLAQLYEEYYMTKEARIRKLGGTLARIETALDNVDMETLRPEQLLDYKLKYTQALKEEYIGAGAGRTVSSTTPEDILEALKDLYNRVQRGEIQAEQANRESAILNNMLKAYDSQVLARKVEALQSTLEGAR